MMQDLIDHVLEQRPLSTLFQPVLESLRPEAPPHYLEARVRGPGDSVSESPEVLVEYARRKQRSSELDRACTEVILEAARELPAGTRIGLNLHASTLSLDLEYLNILGDAATANGIEADRLVIEIVEHAPPWDAGAFRTALEGLRALGCRIALDDIGLGQSNYRMILDCRPDYFKIDRYFVAGASTDFHRQAVLASVAQLARPFGAQVVAEGVESHEDLMAARAAGIGLVQGYHFGRPKPASEFAAPENKGEERN